MSEVAGLMGILWIFGLVMAVVWLLLPFAMFGIKPLLRQILAEQRLSDLDPDVHVRCPDCREFVRCDAVKCRHCSCKLVPQKI